ncbi:hypothetical protein EJB05_15397, partial [Eragrostis curvula]
MATTMMAASMSSLVAPAGRLPSHALLPPRRRAPLVYAATSQQQKHTEPFSHCSFRQLARAFSMATTVMSSMSSLAFASGVRAGRMSPVYGLAPRRRALVVRAQTEPNVEPTEETTTTTSPASSPLPSTPTPKPKAKPAKPGLWDALAFSGPAPERINGRLAMVGFVSALAVEASQGGGLLSQAGSGSGLAWFAVSAAVLSAASLAPVLQGESAEARSKGFWSADAELWNGRFAMLGLVALAVTEYITGAPFVNV